MDGLPMAGSMTIVPSTTLMAQSAASRTSALKYIAKSMALGAD